MKSYPLGDSKWLNRFDRQVRGVATGEFRAPKRGEWYLSGAIVEAYRAKIDFTHPFHICKLVYVTMVTIEQHTPFTEELPI